MIYYWINNIINQITFERSEIRIKKILFITNVVNITRKEVEASKNLARRALKIILLAYQNNCVECSSLLLKY